MLAPGETHTFAIRLEAGDFARLRVVPQLPRVRVSLQSPAGEEIASRARSDLNFHGETISTIAEKGGTYRLVIESKWPKPGRYTVRLLEHRPSVPADAIRVEAEKFYAEGRKLKVTEERPEMIRAGIVAFERALALFRKIRDDGAVADAENEIGESYGYGLGDYQKGLPNLVAALALRQCLPEAPARGNSLDNIGDVYRAAGQMRKAIVFFEAALPEKNPDVPREVAVTLRNLAMTHDDMGDEEALPQYLRLLEVMREAGEPMGEAFLHHSIALHFYYRGQWQEALEHTHHAIRAFRKVNYHGGEAFGNILLGQVYQAQGEPERALAYFQKALAIPDVSDVHLKAEAMWRISSVYQAIGDVDRAIEQQQQALKTFHDLGDRIMEAEVLRTLGGSFEKKRDLWRCVNR